MGTAALLFDVFLPWPQSWEMPGSFPLLPWWFITSWPAASSVPSSFWRPADCLENPFQLQTPISWGSLQFSPWLFGSPRSWPSHHQLINCWKWGDISMPWLCATFCASAAYSQEAQSPRNLKWMLGHLFWQTIVTCYSYIYIYICIYIYTYIYITYLWNITI